MEHVFFQRTVKIHQRHESRFPEQSRNHVLISSISSAEHFVTWNRLAEQLKRPDTRKKDKASKAPASAYIIASLEMSRKGKAATWGDISCIIKLPDR